MTIVPTILFRKDIDTEEEFRCAKKYFGSNVVELRTEIPNYSRVLGRYSVLPFYEELEKDLATRLSTMCLRYEQHRFVADITKYIPFLMSKGIPTPEVFQDYGYMNVPYRKHGYIVKGETNSRKFLWDTHMYAKNREDLRTVLYNVNSDSLLSTQKIVIRPYIPLKGTEIGINGMPIPSEEYRVFVYKGIPFIAGYYWSISDNPNKKIPSWVSSLASKVAKALLDRVDIFCVDVAETCEGEYIVIELNDFQMSGLSTIDPDEFYRRLYDIVNK